MSSVIARRVRATPHRTAVETWKFISVLLSHGDEAADDELASVDGIVASIVADRVTEGAPIVAIGKGPRVRIYCLFGDDAMTEDEMSEDVLPSSPLQGDWEVYVPFVSEEFEWAEKALEKKSKRVRAYDESAGLGEVKKAAEAASEDTEINFGALRDL